MTSNSLLSVDTWVFDLDNTLYPPSVRLFDQIEARMTDYVMHALGAERGEANRLRALYWRNHGTTLAGLMEQHALEPDAYLAHVHEIDLTGVPPSPELRAAIAALPGRKIIYTNGSREHGRKVSAARGLEGSFDAIYGIEDAGYAPKPRREAFDAIIAVDGLDPARAAMFEDDPRNLVAPHALGMQTVLVGDAIASGHIHHSCDDLAEFLTRLV